MIKTVKKEKSLQRGLLVLSIRELLSSFGDQNYWVKISLLPSLFIPSFLFIGIFFLFSFIIYYHLLATVFYFILFHNYFATLSHSCHIQRCSVVSLYATNKVI